MSLVRRIDLGMPACLEFHGPDAVRFLNGQLTQDVRSVMGGTHALPSCVTDAKGRLQFRVWIMDAGDGAIRVEAPQEMVEALEARLTRYLIADDVEVADLTGQWRVVHFTGPVAAPPAGVIVRTSVRYGTTGTDWWITVGTADPVTDGIELLEGDALEAFRIARGVPAWGRELTEGLLPPEAGLDATDISYQKGCYIGQEVISRIKSVGKVNKRLTRLVMGASVPEDCGILVDAAGATVGGLTSVSPLLENDVRHALGYVKSGVTEMFCAAPDGTRHEIARFI